MHRRWLTRRALLATAAIVIWAPGCVLAGWWQATVAMSGNALGYLYAVEWPVFAVLGVVVWWQLVHDDPDSVGARGLARLRAAARNDATGGVAAPAAATGTPAAPPVLVREMPPADGGRAPLPGRTASSTEGAPRPDGTVLSGYELELAEYNAYLASLRDRRKTWARR